MRNSSYQAATIGVPLAGLTFSVVLFLGAQQMPSARFEPMGPAGFPYIISALLFLLSMLDGAIGFFGKQSGVPAEALPHIGDVGLRRMVFGGACAFAYVIVLQLSLLPFIPASVLFLAGFGLILSNNIRREMLVIGFAALMLGVGVSLLLTRVLIVVLPGA
ncbi:MAG: tripartite tricarboxylate transporter TctB family protein [Sphingomonadales bacterium]|nr:tripartite tricarboxylate transporter TctB family protein [Sphingomonadales bacterium]